jgi:class 3 adenylate cyclase
VAPSSGEESPEPSSAAEPPTAPKIMAILFADAVNFSKLTEREIPRFIEHFLGAIGDLIGRSRQPPVLKNTWGDGLYLVFAGVRAAGDFALSLSEIANHTDWTSKGLPASLNLRIALHAGPVHPCVDPVTGQLNYVGAHVSRGARIEPITPPGQVYASEAFAALASANRVRDFVCEYAGQTLWAKAYGTFPTYHVRRSRRLER